MDFLAVTMTKHKQEFIMQVYKWINQSKNRFYKITIQKEFNKIFLHYIWGSCTSSRGGSKSMSVCSEEEAKKTIELMMKRRKSRGYELVA